MLASNRDAMTPDVSSPTPGDDDDAPLGYHERKVMDLCTYPGCPNPPDRRPGKESCECEEHHDATLARKKRSRSRKRRARNKLRKIWRKKKLCLGCGGKRLPREKHCMKCLVAIGTTADRAATKSGDNKRDRIEARTTIDAGGRSRYRGQGRRGRQSVVSVDAKDLEYAIDALQRTRDGLTFAAAPENAAIPKSARRDAINAALSLANHASRFIDDVLARHGYFDSIAPEGKPIKR